MAWDSEFGFEITRFELKDDYEGRVEATLLSRKSKRTSSNAILYIHGFIDYYFPSNLCQYDFVKPEKI